MKIKEICNKIIYLYEATDIEKKQREETYSLAYKLRQAVEEEGLSTESLNLILETTKRIASRKGYFKQILEEKLLEWISYLPHLLWREDEGEEKQMFKRSKKSSEGKIAEALILFAKEIYEIKLDRDAFSGKRRGFAVRLLKSLSSYFDVPEFMEFCSKSIKSKSKNEYFDSIECLKYYCIEKGEVPSEDLIAIIDKRIEKTKSRSEAVSGLDLQVATGLISEMTALLRIDEWKERNLNW